MSTIDLIHEAIGVLQYIYDVREQLQENQQSSRRLCDEVIKFEALLKCLQTETALESKLAIMSTKQVSEFGISLMKLVQLFKDIQEYFLKYHGRNVFNTVRKAVLKFSKKTEFESFSHRLKNCAKDLEFLTLTMNVGEEHQIEQKELAELEHDVELVRNNEKEVIEQLDGNKLTEDLNKLRIIAKVIADVQLDGVEKNLRKDCLKSLLIDPPTSVTVIEEEKLGEGGFGIVLLGILKPSTKVAVKTASSKYSERNANKHIEDSENELLLMQYIAGHPNILGCYGYFIDETTKTLRIVLEYAPFKSLERILYDKDNFPYLSVRLIVGWLSDLANALNHMHSRKIKHRDIKSENLLLFSDFNVKLCDFGLAKKHLSRIETSHSNVGTDGFKDPRISETGALYASDIFSWSMVAFQMITRRNPKSTHKLETRVNSMIDGIKGHREVQSEMLDTRRFERLLVKCAKVHYEERPLTKVLAKEIMQVIDEFHGDPRLKQNYWDSSYITSLENSAKQLFNAALDYSHPLPSPQMPSGTDIRTLTSDQAIQLLIHFGCCDDLHDRIASNDKKIIFDGSYLLYLQSVEDLQALENDYTAQRFLALQTVLNKFKNSFNPFTSLSISENDMNAINQQLQVRAEKILEDQEKRKTMGNGKSSALVQLHIEEKWDEDNRTATMTEESDQERSISFKDVEVSQTDDQSFIVAEEKDNRFQADNMTIREAINMWCLNPSRALECYGDIQRWDTSQVTNMSELFKNKRSFNDNIRDWDISNVTNMNDMFYGASSFNQPLEKWDVDKVETMARMFYKASSFNQPIYSWNVSNVTNMSHMFCEASTFNYPLDHWNVGNVTDMSSMFSMASSFNQSLKSWKVNKVTTMCSMFCKSVSFNQPLHSWDTSNVTNMLNMFRNASNFDQPLNEWNARKVTNMSGMFGNAMNFNQPLNKWKVNNVTDMSEMFSGATKYNRTLNSWNVGNVVNMSCMFQRACSFNRPLNGWNVQNVNNMRNMFCDATNFNQPLNNWNVGNVTDMSDMFSNATSFNQPIGAWLVNNVTNMNQMFYKASIFDQPLNDWNVCNVVDMSYMFCEASRFNQPLDNWNVCNVTNMKYMFCEASSFNQVVTNGDVSNVTNMMGMFCEASAFNQPLNHWNVSKVTTMSGMFSTACTFNQPLNNWIVDNVESMRGMFSEALAFNQPLNNWNVGNVTNMSGMFCKASRFNQRVNCWEVSNVTDMSEMFAYAIAYNQPLIDQQFNRWDVSNVTNMSEMFFGASEFNQPLNNWDVSNVTNMRGMFYQATSFNQPLDSWDVRNVIDMNEMFSGACSFDQSLSSWNVNDATDMNRMFCDVSHLDLSLDGWHFS